MGLLMQRVYADKRLGYNQGTKFAIPAKFNPCETADTINVNGIQERVLLSDNIYL